MSDSFGFDPQAKSGETERGDGECNGNWDEVEMFHFSDLW